MRNFKEILTGLRMVQPKNEPGLCNVVKWDQSSQKSSHALNNAEESKNDPIRQPLRVFPVVCVHWLEWHISRVNEPDEIDQQFSTTQESQDSGQKCGNGDSKVCLGVASLLFQFLQLIYLVGWKRGVEASRVIVHERAKKLRTRHDHKSRANSKCSSSSMHFQSFSRIVIVTINPSLSSRTMKVPCGATGQTTSATKINSCIPR